MEEANIVVATSSRDERDGLPDAKCKHSEAIAVENPQQENESMIFNKKGTEPIVGRVLCNAIGHDSTEQK